MMWSCLIDSYLDVRCDCGCQLLEEVWKANVWVWLDLVYIDILVEMEKRTEEKQKGEDRIVGLLPPTLVSSPCTSPCF